jgi:hypothetical protein
MNSIKMEPIEQMDVPKLEPQEIPPENFVVEAILDKKCIKKKTYYLVKWQGYDESSNSWEPYQNCKGCKDLIDRYNKSIKEEKEEPPEQFDESEMPSGVVYTGPAIKLLNGAIATCVLGLQQMNAAVLYEDDTVEMVPTAILRKHKPWQLLLIKYYESCIRFE